MRACLRQEDDACGMRLSTQRRLVDQPGVGGGPSARLRAHGVQPAAARPDGRAAQQAAPPTPLLRPALPHLADVRAGGGGGRGGGCGKGRGHGRSGGRDRLAACRSRLDSKGQGSPVGCRLVNASMFCRLLCSIQSKSRVIQHHSQPTNLVQVLIVIQRSPVNNSPVNNSPVNNLFVNNLPVNNSPVNNSHVNYLPVNNFGGAAV